jgi:glycosyltransferase involved in cell wall biosynthesis
VLHLRILLVSSQLPPTISGYAKVAGSLQAAYKRRGHYVECIGEGRGCSRLGRVAKLNKAGRAAIQRQWDVVHIIGPAPVFTEECVHAAKRAGHPVLYTVHGVAGLTTYYDNPIARAVDSVYEHVVMKSVLDRVDVVVFLTEDFRREYLAKPPHFVVIPNGIEPCHAESYHPESRDPDQRPRPVKVLFVGQLRSYKGIQYLLEAVSLLNRLDSGGWSLTIAGRGPDKARLCELAKSLSIADIVRFDTPSDARELHSAYTSHDVLVLPSVTGECFGIVLLEAASHGLPLIASDLPGVREVARRLGGETVRPRDASSVANALLKVRSSPNCGHRFPVTLPFCGWQAIGDAYIKVLAGLVPSPST